MHIAHTFISGQLKNHRNILMVAMLGLLHWVLIIGVEHVWARTLLISHLGVFLLWQPFWRIEDKLGVRGGAFIATAVVAVALWLNWIFLAFWMGVLVGLVRGGIFTSRKKSTRYFHLAALLYVLFVLLLWVAPRTLGLGDTGEFSQNMMFYFMPALLLAMLLVPSEPELSNKERGIDFFYSVLLMLLVAVLIMGVFVIMSLDKTGFQPALVKLIFILAGIMMILGWLWNPRFGLSGLQQSFSSYLLNIGTPLEQWLGQLARHARDAPDAPRFMACAAQLLAKLPWLAGVSWQTPDGIGEAGKRTPYALDFENGDLKLQLWSGQPPTTPMTMHAHLLSRLIGHFYQSKIREVEARHVTHLKTIHDTGARLTHDVKNLLQAFSNLAVAAHEPDHDGGFRELMQRQLPLLGQRLQATLDKLNEPASLNEVDMTSADLWWEHLKTRYENYGVSFHTGSISSGISLPAELFNCASENMLQNASRKQADNPAMKISVEFSANSDGIELRVQDSGPAVEDRVAQRLFKVAVSSQNGLGIGLYQAGNLASQYGYSLGLVSNQDGAVCFSLKLQPK